MMNLNFKAMARATVCALEWERLNERGAFIDENALRRALAEHLQSVTTAYVLPEFNHPDIPGNKRLDVVGFGPQKKKIEFAVESKWIKDGGGTRDWPAEVADDIFRLECLKQDMAQRNHRILVVSGIRQRVSAGLINKGKNVSKKRVKWIDAILPEAQASQAKTMKVRDCNHVYTPFFKKRAQSVGLTKLPVSYQAHLVAQYDADSADKEAVCTYIWLVARSSGRGEFTP